MGWVSQASFFSSFPVTGLPFRKGIVIGECRKGPGVTRGRTQVDAAQHREKKRARESNREIDQGEGKFNRKRTRGTEGGR